MAPGKAAFVLADVSGKGVAAALLMANLQASIRSRFELAGRDPLGLVKSVNALFFEATPPEQYATLFYGQYDDGARELTYLNCGHLPPILVRADRSVERLDSSGTVLGMFRAWNGEVQRVSIGRGDTLALFSDGVTEAGIESDTEYGEERLTAMLASLQGEIVERVLERILDSVMSFSGGRQSDDITLILLRGK